MTGSAVGLILAGAYLGGGLAKATAPQAIAVQSAQLHAAFPVTLPETINSQGARSGELLQASLAGPAAKPFRSGAQSDLDCLTEAVYYEARGEGAAGQAAVAQVVLNRVRHPSFPKSVCAVVYQGCQFSFACDGSTRRGRDGAAWNRARNVASKALTGAVMSNVGNATHFHTVHVAPQWGPSLARVGQVGLHVFYRFSGKNGRPSASSDDPEVSTKPETGRYEYRRLTPEERVQFTSAKLTPAVTITTTGMPESKAVEPASAPIATAAETAVQPASAVTAAAPKPVVAAS